MYILEFFQQHPIALSGVFTILLILIVSLIRWVIARTIKNNKELTKDERRRWLVQVRNGAFLIIILGCTVIWAEQVRFLAISVFAVAVATVIATKELLQCLSGSLLKSTSHSFKVGDRIEVDKWRGDVIDHNALTTTIIEVGPNQLTQQLTGRSVKIPNSVFLTKPVINESFTSDFLLHVFTVPTDITDDWQEYEKDLLSIAQEECKPFRDDAAKHFSKLGNDKSLMTFSVEPRITLQVNKPDEMIFVVRIAVPSRKKGRIEQEILRKYLIKFSERSILAKQKAQEAKEKAKS